MTLATISGLWEDEKSSSFSHSEGAKAKKQGRWTDGFPAVEELEWLWFILSRKSITQSKFPHVDFSNSFPQVQVYTWSLKLTEYSSGCSLGRTQLIYSRVMSRLNTLYHPWDCQCHTEFKERCYQYGGLWTVLQLKESKNNKGPKVPHIIVMPI